MAFYWKSSTGTLCYQVEPPCATFLVDTSQKVSLKKLPEEKEKRFYDLKLNSQGMQIAREFSS